MTFDSNVSSDPSGADFLSATVESPHRDRSSGDRERRVERQMTLTGGLEDHRLIVEGGRRLFEEPKELSRFD